MTDARKIDRDELYDYVINGRRPDSGISVATYDLVATDVLISVFEFLHKRGLSDAP